MRLPKMTELLGGLTVVELLGGLADVSSDAKTYIEKKNKKNNPHKDPCRPLPELVAEPQTEINKKVRRRIVESLIFSAARNVLIKMIIVHCLFIFRYFTTCRLRPSLD